MFNADKFAQKTKGVNDKIECSVPNYKFDYCKYSGNLLIYRAVRDLKFLVCLDSTWKNLRKYHFKVELSKNLSFGYVVKKSESYPVESFI